MKNWSFLNMLADPITFKGKAPTKCVTIREVPLLFSAMKRNGLGAACTAVLVKLRFPRMSCMMSTVFIF